MFKLVKTAALAILVFITGTSAQNLYGVPSSTVAYAQDRNVVTSAANALITSETGLSESEILEAYAVTEPALFVPVGVNISIPIQAEPALYYLLIFDTVSNQWNRYFFSKENWLNVIQPELAAAGVDVYKQERGTADTVSALNEATAIAAQSYFGGEHIANVLLHGDPNGAAGGVQTPPAAHVETAPPISTTVAGDRIGTIAANFRVDESGAATYSISIATALGTAGVAPQIALGYSSSGGNGIAGQGWSLSGVSSIARCRKTLAVDQAVAAIKWAKDDALCLDGQRLLLTGGTYGEADSKYRTEIDSGAIVTIESVVGIDPTSFSVERRDGSTSYYGLVSGSSETDAIFSRAGNTRSDGKAAVANHFSWSIKKFEDNLGNFIWFKYDSDTQQQVIREIRYAYGNSSDVDDGFGARVVFDYASGARPDPQGGYLGGHLFRKDKLLQKITSFNRYITPQGNETQEVLREYVLTYQPPGAVPGDSLSRLASIEECVGTVCLPATEFNWRLPSTSAPNQSLGTFTMANSNHKVLTYQMGDIDGDGKTDFAWVEASYGSNNSTMQPRINYALSSGNTYQQKKFTNNTFELIFPHISSNKAMRLALVDYNLDGRSDVFYFDHTTGRWRVYLSIPQTDGTWQISASPIVTAISHENATFADINSDGATDIIYKTGDGYAGAAVKVRKLVRNSNPDSSNVAYSFSSEIPVVREGGGSTFTGKISTTGADFNGDGRTDIFFAGFQRFVEPCQSSDYQCRVPDIINRTLNAFTFSGDPNASPLTVAPYSSFNNAVPASRYILPERVQFVDANADGLTDVFYQVANIGSNAAVQNVIRINKGNGQFGSLSIVEPTLGKNSGSRDGSIDQPQFLDWNMDGYSDLVWKSLDNGQSYIRYWQPGDDDYADKQSFGSSINSDRVPVFYPDVNADGVLDQVILDNRENVGRITAHSRHTLTLVHPGGTSDYYGESEPVYASQGVASRAANRIDTITNGLGMVTAIDYEPLTGTPNYARLALDNTVTNGTVCFNEPEIPGGEFCYEDQVEVTDANSFYRQLNGDWDLPANTETLGKTTPVLEINTPMYVVTSVESDAPAAGNSPRQVDHAARTKLSYFYAQANVQAAGRGFLGFRKLTTRDEQTGVTTTSTYRQDWPFIGYALTTETKTSAGHTLSQSTSDWGFLEHTRSAKSVARTVGTQALGPMHPVMKRSTESKYDLKSNGTQAGAKISTTVTESTFDSETNPIGVTVSHYDGQDTLVKTIATTNTYFNNGDLPLRQSRLKSSEVETTRAGAGSKTRYSEFNYYTRGAKQGMLRQEKIEPGSPYATTSTHDYDEFGNKVKTSTTSVDGTRCDVVTSKFDTRGRYLIESYNCLGQLVSRIMSQSVTGATTKARVYVDNNTFVESFSAYSALGREYFQRDDRGPFSTSEVTANLSNCPAGSVFKRIAKGAGGGESAECLDKLARAVRSMSRGFDGTWNAVDSEYDSLNRIRRHSEPFSLPGTPTLWSRNDYDLVGRVTKITHPDGSDTEFVYNGLTKTTINDHGHRHIASVNILGERVRIEDDIQGVTRYEYDAHGSLSKVIDNAGNEIVTLYDPLGRKHETTDPDKGTWKYGFNAFGEMLWQQDALGQRTEISYDSLGRTVRRKDFEAPATRSSQTTGPLVSETEWEYDTAPNGMGQLARLEDLTSGYRQTFSYDDFGRASETVTRIDGTEYRSKVTYDEYSRTFQTFDQAGDGSYDDRGVVKTYNSHGFVESISDAVIVNGKSRTVYRKTLEVNERGQVVREVLGNGVVVSNGYDDETGRTIGIYSAGAEGEVQDLRYLWDTVGNLKYRHEYSGSKELQELFSYDDLNRLTRQSVAGQTAIDVTYHDGQNEKLGNIKSKTGVGTYEYGQNGGGPHAVSRVGGIDYSYDANGNNTGSDDGRSIDYTVFNKVERVARNGHVSEFKYGPDRSRYQRIDSNASGTTTTTYVGNIEVIERPDGTLEKKRYIGGVVVQTIFHGNNTTEDYREDLYIFKDHLGSIDVIADNRGNVVQEMSFDAWGKRRNAANWQGLNDTQLAAFDSDVTNHGFTGHEMLDEVGIVHMGGRIYDADLGRFLQADPAIQSLFLTQAINRYSYGMNNPLNGTDPSGYFWNIIGYAVAGFIAGKAAQALDIPVLSAIANIAVCVTAGPACAVAFSFSSTLGAGGSFASALKSGLFAGVSAAAFGAIGDKFVGKSGFFKMGGAAHIGAHAITGGILSVAQGGKFGHGFLTAGLTKALNINELIDGAEVKHDVIRAVTAAIVGGTVSAISGGKFVNGAITAGFAQAYNGNSFWRKARELGKFATEFVAAHGGAIAEDLVPGVALYNCVKSGKCGYFDWAMAVGDLTVALAGGGVVLAAFKSFKAYGRIKTATRSVNKACNCCFAEGTEVSTASGLIPIDELRPGDEVQSRNMETGAIETQPVTNLFRYYGKEIYVLTTRNSTGDLENTEVTDNHPYWVEGTGWVDSAQLEAGMLLTDINGDKAEVLSIEPQGRTDVTFNLEVDVNHNFFVGEQQVLTHNECSCGITFRSPDGRLRNADGTFAPDGGSRRVSGGTHGNTAGSQPATLYERYDADGNFLKHGISQNPSTRYTQKELNGGYLVETQSGPRVEMLKIERNLVETKPGPLNKESWAGSRSN